MELFIRKVKIKSVIISWLSCFGYFILSVLRYFVFDVICCCVCMCRPEEEQGNQDGVVMAECATKYNHAESVMVVGTRTIFRAFMIQDYKIRELKEAYFPNSTSFDSNTTNSDDSDCDGDDEYSEDDETENELGRNNSGEYCGRGISEDTCEERFEIVSEQTDITTAKPFKPKKTKPKRKRAKLKQTKPSRPFHPKRKKPTRNNTIEEQGTGSVTDHPMYTWDGGTTQYHPIKGPHGKCSTTTAVDQGSCTTTCVQCFDED